MEELFDLYASTPFGQQASVFTTFTSPHQGSMLLLYTQSCLILASQLLSIFISFHFISQFSYSQSRTLVLYLLQCGCIGDVSRLLDVLGTSVGRININTQCGRSPDTVPFSGRRSSALGTMRFALYTLAYPTLPYFSFTHR